MDHPLTLNALLNEAISSDVHEEAAADFLHDRRIPCFSHNRLTILTLAWKHGWRPQ
jgi:hypothetical protein